MLDALLLFAASLAAPRGPAPPGPPLATSTAAASRDLLGAAHWPTQYALTGTRSESQYVYTVRLVRDGDSFVLSGGAPAGTAGARITVRVDARGGVSGSDSAGRAVVCGAGASRSCSLPLHGFLAAAAAVAALRRGVAPPPVARGRFAGRRVVCVDAAALAAFAGDAPPVVDPCLDTATGAVLAFRHRRSGRFEGASLDPESIRIELGPAAAQRPRQPDAPPS